MLYIPDSSLLWTKAKHPGASQFPNQNQRNSQPEFFAQHSLYIQIKYMFVKASISSDSPSRLLLMHFLIISRSSPWLLQHNSNTSERFWLCPFSPPTKTFWLKHFYAMEAVSTFRPWQCIKPLENGSVAMPHFSGASCDRACSTSKAQPQRLGWVSTCPPTWCQRCSL